MDSTASADVPELANPNAIPPPPAVTRLPAVINPPIIPPGPNAASALVSAAAPASPAPAASAMPPVATTIATAPAPMTPILIQFGPLSPERVFSASSMASRTSPPSGLPRPSSAVRSPIARRLTASLKPMSKGRRKLSEARTISWTSASSFVRYMHGAGEGASASALLRSKASRATSSGRERPSLSRRWSIASTALACVARSAPRKRSRTSPLRCAPTRCAKRSARSTTFSSAWSGMSTALVVLTISVDSEPCIA